MGGFEKDLAIARGGGLAGALPKNSHGFVG
jgi:hypothetical protein